MHYVIIGNGVAGATAAFTIREREPEARVTMISGESDYFFSRTALMYALMDKMSLQDLEPFERHIYDKKKIDRLREWVADLDAGRRLLKMRSGALLSYDRLLIATGSRPNLFPWKGVDKIRPASSTSSPFRTSKRSKNSSAPEPALLSSAAA